MKRSKVRGQINNLEDQRRHQPHWRDIVVMERKLQVNEALCIPPRIARSKCNHSSEHRATGIHH